MINKLRNGLVGLGLLACVGCEVAPDYFYEVFENSENKFTRVEGKKYISTHGLYTWSGPGYFIAENDNEISILWVDGPGRHALTDTTGDSVPDIKFERYFAVRAGSTGGFRDITQKDIDFFQYKVNQYMLFLGEDK
jgi:hypothetical protein